MAYANYYLTKGGAHTTAVIMIRDRISNPSSNPG